MQILLDCAGDLRTCCNDYALANVLGTIKRFIDLIHILIPILLIIMVIVNFIHLMSNPDDKKGKKALVNRFLAAVIIFFIPTIVNVIINIVPLPYNVISCWNGADTLKKELERKKVLYLTTDEREKESILIDPSDYEGGEKVSTGLDFTDFKHLEKYNQTGKYRNRKVCANGKGSTVGSSACGLSTYMAVRYILTGKDTNFMDFCHEACARGVYSRGSALSKTDNSFYEDKYGITHKKIAHDYNTYVNELKKGNVVFVSIQCGYRTVGNGGFNATSNGHYIVLVKYDESKDQIYVYNPAASNTGWTKKDKVMKYILGCIKSSRSASKK